MLNIRRHVIGINGRLQVGRGPHIADVIVVAAVISATRVVFAVVSIVLLVVMAMRAHFKSLAGWRDNQSILFVKRCL